MTISHICGNWPLYFTLKNKSGPVGIEKSIFMKSVFYKSCFFWSKLQKKHCPKLQFQKIKFMKRPNTHALCQFVSWYFGKFPAWLNIDASLAFALETLNYSSNIHSNHRTPTFGQRRFFCKKM